jgi:hypothetical protein
VVGLHSIYEHINLQWLKQCALGAGIDKRWTE